MNNVTTFLANVTTFLANVVMFLANVAKFLANIMTLLEIYEQRRDVEHKRHDVAVFSSDEKVAKIQSLGLLHTSKLLFLHINHPRSSHNHIQ